MYSVNTRRLPGIRFQVEPPMPEEALPRMDIAAFVGFAASGPLDIPVPVEDMERFRDIFGEDLVLARDPETGQVENAYLGPAVEAFFKNGGKRCWVVRVAGTAAANSFLLPGLVSAGDLKPVLARARCEGSWSDLLLVGTKLNQDYLTVMDLQYSDSVYSAQLVSVPGQVETGDLVRIENKLAGTKLVLFLAVDAINDKTLPNSQSKYRVVRTIEGKNGCWFRMEDNRLFSLEESEGVDWWQTEFRGSPPGESEDPVDISAYRLTFDILVWKGETVEARMDGLGFYDKHPRFWANLPLDKELFVLPVLAHGDKTRQSTNETITGTISDLESDALEPRFPLAGPAVPAELYLPMDMAETADKDGTESVYENISGDDALERDGLENFDTAFFLDPDLADVGTAALIGEANHKYCLKEDPEPLLGFHSVLPLEEVTIAAVPDALHRGWERSYKKPVPWLDAPVPESCLALETGSPPVSITAPEGGVIIRWQPVADNAVYTLEESEEPLFTNPVTIYRGKKPCVPVIPCTRCARRYFYRVNARLEDRQSPWSGTLDVTLAEEDFSGCGQPHLQAPDLEPVSTLSPGNDEYLLQWSEVDGADGYVLEESQDPLFSDAVVIYEDKEPLFFLKYRSAESEVYYYRVRAVGVPLAAWSNTQRLAESKEILWQMKAREDYSDDGLLELHQSLMRFCAARGDIMAVLTLPGHYREEDALTHVQALVGVSEEKNLSFAALYHPWTLTRIRSGAGGDSGRGSLRYIPPDGAVCGTIAARALKRGAWIAPANEPLQGVTALSPLIHSRNLEQLYLEQVNIICSDPRGFMVLSADTLSPDSALQPINVRRLLILLRRLAYREGMSYVFQPNTRNFQRRVKYRFEQFLARMYSFGAFAGDSPETSFQVVTDSSVNTAASLQLGRFIIELRVAPSLPMTFITVRLVQTHGEGLSIKEV